MAYFKVTDITQEQLIDAGQGVVSGPLAGLDLASSDFTYNLYQYPLTSVEPDYPSKSHQIIFYINVPTTSYWGDDPSPNAPDPVANRASDATKFALRNDATPATNPISDAAQTIGDALTYASTSVVNQIIKRKSKRTTAAISLYIPNQLIFGQNMSYENVSLTQSLGVGADAAAFLTGMFSGSGKVAAGALGSMLPDVNKFFGNKIKGLSTIDDNLLSALGLADNPMNYVMFKQIDFRKFRFDFLLTPENTQESKIINQIIYLFRFHSAPEIASGSSGRFFVPPSDFDIDILHNGQRNNTLPRISTCVCNNVNVTYGANGQWSTTYDGQAQQIGLSLDFTETEIMTKDRISQGF